MKLNELIGQPELPHSLTLNFSELSLELKSNSPLVLQQLADYFSTIDQSDNPDGIPLLIVDQAELQTELSFSDWAREAGKKGRKDTYLDCPNGVRILRKVKTGMVFYQSREVMAAIGPVMAHSSQVINFVLSQVMTRLQWDGGLICHAAAATCAGRSLVLAGFSGMGKSTLMLKLLDANGVAFTSNDRVFVNASTTANAQMPVVQGIAKMPRINPGTVVGNKRLHGLMSTEKLAAYQSMQNESPEALWQLEQKLDVPVPQVFGENKVAWSGELAGLVILNWKPGSAEPACLRQIDLNERLDLIPAIQKSPGPFYQLLNGQFLSQPEAPSEVRYLSAFGRAPVYELTGGAHFDQAAEALIHALGWSS